MKILCVTLLLVLVAGLAAAVAIPCQSGNEDADAGGPVMKFLKNPNNVVPGALLMIFIFVFKCTCPGSGKVWSKTQGRFVPEAGPLAVTSTDGGLAPVGLLLALVFIGVVIYVCMKM